jgi:hypothetical protein
MALRRSPKPGALTAATCKGAAQFVDHQRGQGFAVDILGDDHERFAHFGNLLKNRQEIFHIADFFLIDQNIGVL